MNNSITVFENNQFGKVRSILNEGEPWFVAADVCQALDIINTADAVVRLDDDEKGIASIYTLGGKQRAITVNEYGLYNLILASRKPEAKSFKRWITHEVIPSIRKTGSYSIQGIDHKKLPSTNHAASILMRTFKAADANMVSLASTIAAMYRSIGVPVPAIEAPTEIVWLTATDIAERIGVLSTNGKPHGQVVSGVISLLDIPENMKQLMTFENNGHSGTVTKYSPEVADKVQDYLTDGQYPQTISLRDKSFKVVYKQ